MQAAEPPPRSREVEALIQEAEEAAKRLELARARALWARVNALEPSTMAVCQLGVFDLRLDRLAEAAAEFSTCVEQMPAPTSDIERRRYEVRRADLAAVRQRVAELQVSAPPGTARLVVSGKQVSAGRPVFVVPGQHEVTATGKQGQVAHALVKVTAGEATSCSTRSAAWSGTSSRGRSAATGSWSGCTSARARASMRACSPRRSRACNASQARSRRSSPCSTAV
ncbi:hypothetical protein [Sorangium cellulosum]|uniref:hypothetical protein n=1 Tax=Sorangium cellulosum TaxID=56 RepID=UPI001F4455D5|nr:hypothetical protein [Sorangium cellulosum]